MFISFVIIKIIDIQGKKFCEAHSRKLWPKAIYSIYIIIDNSYIILVLLLFHYILYTLHSF